MQEITCFCKRCKKSLRIGYIVSGNDDTPVLANIQIACHHCKRVMYLKILYVVILRVSRDN